MKNYLLFILALVCSSVAYGQTWTPAPLTGGNTLSVNISSMDPNYVNNNSTMAVFVVSNTSGQEYNLGQTVIGSSDNITYTGYMGANGEVQAGDVVSRIEVYDGAGSGYYEVIFASSPTQSQQAPTVEEQVIPLGGGLTTTIRSVNYDNGGTPLAPAQALPVELKSFEGMEDDKAVVLNWVTASELDNDFFTVEHSTDGKNFEALGKVKGAGTSTEENSYSFRDEDAANGENYYRLKQTDFDGQFEYSEVISVKLNRLNGKLEIYPNPVVDIANVALPKLKGRTDIEVMDLTGRVVLSETLENAEENQVYQLDLSELNNGTYIVSLRNENVQLNKQIQLIAKY